MKNDAKRLIYHINFPQYQCQNFCYQHTGTLLKGLSKFNDI